MACGSCAKRRGPVNPNTNSPESYNLTGGVDIKSMNDNQIRARLEVFKRRFCRDCSIRYTCDYPIYITCKGLKKR